MMPHAQALYHACTVRRSAGGEGKGGDVLDFHGLIRALFPAANARDISNLMSLLRTKKPVLAQDQTRAKKYNKMLVEAREQFDIYNSSNDGALTRAQFETGMRWFGIPEDELETHLEELFEDQPPTAYVEFEQFFKWFSSMDSVPVGVR